jgi:hypothetical protein
VGAVVWAIENAQIVIVLRPSQSEVGNGLMEFTGDAILARLYAGGDDSVFECQ